MISPESKRSLPERIVENAVTGLLLVGWIAFHPRKTLEAIRTHGMGSISRSHKAIVKSLH